MTDEVEKQEEEKPSGLRKASLDEERAQLQQNATRAGNPPGVAPEMVHKPTEPEVPVDPVPPPPGP